LPDAANAVAAAAVVGAGVGVDVELPDDVQEWLATVDPSAWPPLVPEVVRALDGVLEESELRELWDEAGDGSWSAGTRALRNGIAAAAPGENEPADNRLDVVESSADELTRSRPRASRPARRRP
jgi:hypothetical protein